MTLNRRHFLIGLILMCAVGCTAGEATAVVPKTELARDFVQRWEQAIQNSDGQFLAGFHPQLPVEQREMYLSLMQSMLAKFNETEEGNAPIVDCDNKTGTEAICLVSYHFDTAVDAEVFSFSITHLDKKWVYYQD